MKKLLIILTLVLLIGCATVSTFHPQKSDLASMQQKVPGISFEEVQHGFQLYKINCSGCHNLFKPDAYTISEWEKVLPEMLKRAKIQSDKETQPIKNYLFAKSK